MKIETHIALDRFKPRPYQQGLLNAWRQRKKRIICIWPRRAGKDLCAWQICIAQCISKPCVVYYCLPTYSQARKVIFDSITINGQRFIDFIPSEIIAAVNTQEMKIRFKNGSLLQCIGADSYDTSLVGTNPQLIVFSEWALCDPRAYQFARPILSANDGAAIFLTTPRGKNHAWEMYNIALNSPDWYAEKLTVEDTHHISLADIEKEKQELSEDLIMQEYYCSFDMGVEGSYYAKYLDRLRTNGQIGMVPWEPAFKVHTAWDLGVRDSTSIIFFQTVGQTVRIIDCYEKNKEGLEHYVKVIESKPYSYGRHIAPHDIGVMEFGSGITRRDKAKQLGINFTLANDASVPDGIESVRSSLNKMWFDEVKCNQLIKSLENYRQEYDVKKKIYKSQPLHDWSSHFADAMRYLCVSLAKTKDGLTEADLEKRRREAIMGPNANMPSVFRDDLPQY